MCGFKYTIRILFTVAIFLTSLSISCSTQAGISSEVPVFYKGRFRPLDAYAKLWLYDIYHKQSIDGMSQEFLWKIAFEGTDQIQETPLFWVHYATIKEVLGLDLKRNRFSYSELTHAINPRFLEGLAAFFYHQSSRSGKVELTQLSPDLWVSKNTIIKTPRSGMFSHLKQGQTLPDSYLSKPEVDEGLALLNHLQQFHNWDQGLILKMLPSKSKQGEWLSISVLAQQGNNPTLYSDSLYQLMQDAYAKKDIPFLSALLLKGYSTIAGTAYQEANGKSLTYPTLSQLKIETIYYQYPLIEITLFLYGVGIFLYFFGYCRLSLISVSLAFVMHTGLLAMRCYILGRPPVSNMFETVIYVPWIAMLIGFAFRKILRMDFILPAAAFVAMALLLVLKVSEISSSMENVQAVLDSQYWLIIHVLLVVGSYGLFVLAGVLGQVYLAMTLINVVETDRMKRIAQATLQAMYIGVAMLIPGTILGGVWAAESWGRFWDWDPKESWAFISSCVYLMFIHAYTFRHIGNFGLAMGAVTGLLAISFTWYGVNYILGTGLHSYGFGSGGEWIYYSFVIFQLLFLGVVGFQVKRKGIQT